MSQAGDERSRSASSPTTLMIPRLVLDCLNIVASIVWSRLKRKKPTQMSAPRFGMVLFGVECT